MFVAFEGPESVGKTTMINRFNDHNSVHDIYTTREPGTPEIEACSNIRDILLNSDHLRTKSELFLFLADRSEHYHKEIKPALDENDLVLTDRYALSTAIYQFGEDFINNEQIRKTFLEMHQMADIEFPDVTIVFDASFEVTKQRMDDDKLDRIESKGDDYLRSISSNFQESFLSIYPGLVYHVDAEQSKDDLFCTLEELIIEELENGTGVKQ